MDEDAPIGTIEGADWPMFGWQDDIRPALARALEAGRPAVLATLYRVEGSSPRGPGAQMLFDGARASGYFSGDCIEGDVAAHAAEILADGVPQRLHYGTGSPWIDIRLRCGGALFIFAERIAGDSVAARQLLDCAQERRSCIWSSDGIMPVIEPGDGPLIEAQENPLHLKRRFDPPRRLVVTGGDPGSLALARLGMEAQFETILIRPNGPEGPPPFPVSHYLRGEPADILPRIGMDRWTAYIGATHEDHHDLGGCLYALQNGAAFVGMIGAKVRAPERAEALARAGATDKQIEQLHFAPGIPGLGKAPWDVAIGIIAEVMQALNPRRERA